MQNVRYRHTQVAKLPFGFRPHCGHSRTGSGWPLLAQSGSFV